MLPDKNPDTILNMNWTHIDLNVFRVVTLQPNQNAYTSYQIVKQQQQVKYIYIIPCWFLFLNREAKNSRLVYNIMINNKNTRIFFWKLVLCNNGVLTIGSFLLLILKQREKYSRYSHYLHGSSCFCIDYTNKFANNPHQSQSLRK